MKSIDWNTWIGSSELWNIFWLTLAIIRNILMKCAPQTSNFYGDWVEKPKGIMVIEFYSQWNRILFEHLQFPQLCSHLNWKFNTNFEIRFCYSRFDFIQVLHSECVIHALMHVIWSDKKNAKALCAKRVSATCKFVSESPLASMLGGNEFRAQF